MSHERTSSEGLRNEKDDSLYRAYGDFLGLMLCLVAAAVFLLTCQGFLEGATILWLSLSGVAALASMFILVERMMAAKRVSVVRIALALVDLVVAGLSVLLAVYWLNGAWIRT